MSDDRFDNWIRYSTLGIEMAVIVGASVWGGVAIDRHRGASFPLFTLLLTAMGFAVALTRLLRGIK